MFKSLRTNNGTQAALGNPQTQSPEVVPVATSAHDTVIDTQVLTSTSNHSSDTMKLVTSPTLAVLALAVVNDPKMIMPACAPAKFNRINATGISQLPTDLDQGMLDQAATKIKQFQPYEQLTGISQERPEIVMMTNFLPVFDGDSLHGDHNFLTALESNGVNTFMTNAGKFIDVQYQLSRLRQDNVIQHFQGLRQYFSPVQQFFDQQHAEFTHSMEDLQDTATFLLTIVRNMSKLRDILDLHHEFHLVDPVTIISILAGLLITDSQDTDGIIDFTQRNLPLKYTLMDNLIRLGYSEAAVRQTFSSTKLWLQMLIELKQIIQHHSPEFLDQLPTDQSADVGALSLTPPRNDFFDFKSRTFIVDNVSDLENMSLDDLPRVTKQLGDAYKNFYTNVNFHSDEAKIAALVNLISHEFKYSVGLSTQDAQLALVNQYAYATNTDSSNHTVFDFVFGIFGKSVTDVAATIKQSLAGLSQRITPSPDRDVTTPIVVLPFETRFLETTNGTITPGSTHYVEELLNTEGKAFNVGHLIELANSFDSQTTSLNTLLATMNLAAIGPAIPTDPIVAGFKSTLNSGTAFANYLISNFVNVVTDFEQPNDPLAAFYTLATQNPQLKALMFLLALLRMTQSTGGEFPSDSGNIGPLMDQLAQQIGELAYSSTVTIDANKTPSDTISVDRDAIIVALKGDGLPKIIDSVMLTFWNVLGSEHALTSDFKTLYSGQLDTVMMMAMFDLICDFVARYSGQSVLGTYQSKTQDTLGIEYFIISHKDEDYTVSTNAVTSKLDQESALLQQLLYGTFSIMIRLGNATKGYLNFFNSPTSLQKLDHVASTINNVDLLKMFMSEQQIMMFVSTVSDLMDRLNGGSAITNSEAETNAEQVKILDDSIVSPKLRDALYRVMSSSEFTTKKGNNKRILTLGIPFGFSKNLHQTSESSRTLLNDKANDIINVLVYKVDIENSDLVFKPQHFLFELSRFPVRSDKNYLDLASSTDALEPIWSIPTRDYSGINSDIQYAISRVGDVTEGKPTAFDDDQYSFLSAGDRAELLRNHVMSLLLESYIRLLTGISTADYHFDMTPPPPRYAPPNMIKLMVDSTMHLMNQRTTVVASTPGLTNGKLFAPTFKPPIVTNQGTPTFLNNDSQGFESFASGPAPDSSVSLKAMDTRQSFNAYHDLKTINSFSSMVTSVSDGTTVVKRFMSPKQFDRVFNIIVDPDEFEVDVVKTMASPLGKDALAQLIQQGKVVTLDKQFTLRPDVEVFDLEQYKFIEKDKNESDLTFDKYFVVVETYDGTQ